MNEQKVIDYITKWAKEEDITDRNSYQESYQSDVFGDHIEDFVENILELAGVFDDHTE